MHKGVITREFAAAAMAVDLETPIFSAARETLPTTIPPQFRFRLLESGNVPEAHPDQLTRDVIAKLRALSPLAGSPEAEFLALLESQNPADALRAKVIAYLERVRAKLADPQQRPAEIDRLYRTTLQRRADAASGIPALIESPLLFPVGTSQ